MKTFDLKRSALHFPVGLFVAWLSVTNPVLCVLLGFGFLTYEVTEDWRIKDRGFLDIAGYLFGIAAGAIGIQILTILSIPRSYYG